MRTLAAAVLGLLVLVAPPFAAQTRQTRDVMREKLARSERLLAALVTSDWQALGDNGRGLEAVTRQAGWNVLRRPEFADYTAAFQAAAGDVITAAGQRDQQAALEAYNGLVASCVACHRYVSRARLAR